MKRFLKYAFAVLGWLVAIAAVLWGINRCTSKEKSLQAKINKIETVKQNPVSTYMDESGREHVKFPDGTVASLPKNPAKQQIIAYLRDSLFTPDILKANDNAQITAVSKVTTRTTGSVSKAVLDSLPKHESIKVDPWLTLFPNGTGGFKYAIDQGLNSARHTERSGLFNLKRKPYISFFSDNPNAKITGYEKYDYPLPVVQPTLKVYAEADYNIKAKQPSTDVGVSLRLGRFEAIGYGRLDLPSISPFINQSLTPSYGIKLKYNIIQL